MWNYSRLNKILTARWVLPSDVQRACSQHGLWRLLSIVENPCTIPGNPPEVLCPLEKHLSGGFRLNVPPPQ